MTILTFICQFWLVSMVLFLGWLVVRDEYQERQTMKKLEAFTSPDSLDAAAAVAEADLICGGRA